MINLILVRHGQSFWNLQNRFTGWTDVGLTQQGMEEAYNAGKILQKNNLKVDFAFVSVLIRAEQTYQAMCKEFGYKIRTFRSWKLNERHYGALQGLNKKETAEKYGDERVRIWRRSYSVRPPMLEESDPRNPNFDELYKNLKEKMPLGESLEDTSKRVLEYYNNIIKTTVKPNQTALVVAHGNSLRALIQHLDKMSNTAVETLEIPTGKPILYQLTDNFEVISHKYL